MRSAILYDALAPVYGRVLAPLQEVAVARAAERALGGWPGTVLEVGVGPGHGIVRLAHPTRRTIGVDLSRQMLRLAAARLDAEHMDASLARASVLQLPFPSNRFDAVLSTGLLDLLIEVDIPVAVGELARVTVGGGRVVLGIMELPNKVIERAWMVAYRAVPELVGRCRPVKLERYLPESGLRIIRDEHVPGVIGMRLVTLVKAHG
jgi:ubiquinone/menaquinone biosynthesis C-methylase UbiE